MEWSETAKIEMMMYCNKITTSKTAKKYLQLCLARIEVLERANESFGQSMEKFADQLPDMLQNELDRRTELHVKAPDELESPAYKIIEKGGKQPPNPPPPPSGTKSIPNPPDK